MPKLKTAATLTPVDSYGGWWAKRDDLACAAGPDFPAGSKVRQYEHMARAFPGAPMLVGCSAGSAMQIYVAAAAYRAGVAGIVYTAKRAVPTEATAYAARYGAEVNGVRPGYLSYIRAMARKRGKELARVVRWDVAWALHDAAEQTGNVPDGVTAVVVPSGSGLTAAGVLAGLAQRGRNVAVLAVAVSGMATAAGITALAGRLYTGALPELRLVRAAGGYDRGTAARLPDGTPLDPYYAAKAVPYVTGGCLLWVPGVRPVSAFPANVRRELAL